MKILFVCKHNRFRSKSAEALFRKYNKNPRVTAESAGTLGSLNKTSDAVKKVLAERGAKVVSDTPRVVTAELMSKFDKIIVVADNVSLEEFPLERTEVWKISDCGEHVLEDIRPVVDKIEEKVKDLVKELSE